MEHPLRKFRIANGLTQRAMAQAIGTSLPSLCRLEAGKQWPSRDLAVRIVAATKGQVTADDFLRPPFKTSTAA